MHERWQIRKLIYAPTSKRWFVARRGIGWCRVDVEFEIIPASAISFRTQLFQLISFTFFFFCRCAKMTLHSNWKKQSSRIVEHLELCELWIRVVKTNTQTDNLCRTIWRAHTMTKAEWKTMDSGPGNVSAVHTRSANHNLIVSEEEEGGNKIIGRCDLMLVRFEWPRFETGAWNFSIWLQAERISFRFHI